MTPDPATEVDRRTWLETLVGAAEQAATRFDQSTNDDGRWVGQALHELSERLRDELADLRVPGAAILGPMDPRAERIGRNEVLFRQVNERLMDLGTTVDRVTEHADFVCECGDASCTERIRLSLPDYERLRSKPAWFAIVPGHEISDVESVVEEHDGWHVVQKHSGGPAELAKAEDPRS